MQCVQPFKRLNRPNRSADTLKETYCHDSSESTSEVRNSTSEGNIDLHMLTYEYIVLHVASSPRCWPSELLLWTNHHDC